MHARQRDNARTELRVLAAVMSLPDEWQRAQEVASAVAMPWRKVAFALRRLAQRGYVEQEVVTYRGKHRTKEYTTRYRAVCDRKEAKEGFMSRYFSWVKV